MFARPDTATSIYGRWKGYWRACGSALSVALPGTLVPLLLYFLWRTAVELSFQHPPAVASGALTAIIASFLWLYGSRERFRSIGGQYCATRTLRWEWLVVAVAGWMVVKCSLFALWNVRSPSGPGLLAGYLTAPLGWLPVLLSATLAIPLIEETFLRGFIQSRLLGVFGTRAAVTMSVVLTTVLHHRSAALPLIVAGALVTGAMVALFGSVWAGILAHSAGNIALGVFAILPREIGPSGLAPPGEGALPLLLLGFGSLSLCVALSAGQEGGGGTRAAEHWGDGPARPLIPVQATTSRARHDGHPLPEAK